MLVGREIQIPNATGAKNLDELNILGNFAERSAKETNAFIKAARLYQQAIWIADVDPALAWLLFVSALETLALIWSSDKSTPVHSVNLSHPKLIELLNNEAPNLTDKVANMLVDLVGSTRKFVDFLARFCPEPPKNRPARAFQFPFNEVAIRSAAKIIYGHRSKSLHAGTAFPLPMCSQPKFLEFPDETDVGYQEIPMGLATSAHGASWKITQTPMLLHMFEHITRGAIIAWWKSLDGSRQIQTSK